MRQITLIALMVVSISRNYAQNVTANSFGHEAHIEDSLMVKAYERKDVADYKAHLNKFLAGYNRLGKEEKAGYAEMVGNEYYNLVCTYALLGDKKNALANFKTAGAKGYSDYKHILEDTDLDTLRKEPEFKQIAAYLQSISDYVYILKHGKTYNSNQTKPLPKFKYMPANNPDLVALRKGFNLDSVAGDGDEISKITRMLHWLHDMVPHDGHHDNPTVKNAMSMIAECKAGNRGLNCRGLTIVLNECYLSMGFKSRLVTCLPKDSLGRDNDCHVINAVYSQTLKKWLWMDATNDTWVMDDKGNMLSIEEVRFRLINDLPLTIDPKANWNHKEDVKKEYYLYNYMAKNLYMLECPVVSQYNMETHEQGKTIEYIKLLPLEDARQQETKGGKTYMGTTMIIHKTNNERAFWEAPESN